MPRLRLVLALVFTLLSFCRASAHSPQESTLALFRSDEGCELIAEITVPNAARLLPSADSESLSRATFPDFHDALRAAVGRVCNLVDREGHPIPSTRDMVSMNHQGELRIVRLYGPNAAPSAVRFDLLGELPPGHFCTVSDQSTTPARQQILLQESPRYDLTLP